MYRFLREPKWILSHLFVVALVATMIFLGFWQLNRLSDRKATNVLIEARADADPIGLGQALASQRNNDGTLGDVRYLNVEVTGTYLPETIFIDNRSFDGAPGSWLATPFAIDGSAVGQDAAASTGSTSSTGTVLVVRGFVGRATALNSAPADLAAPVGQQTLVGLLQPGADGGGFAVGREGLAAISRPNVDAIASHYGIELDPVYLQLEAPIESLLAGVPRPESNNGSHLSYAVQWFTFSTIGVVGYALILRRRAGSPGRPAKPTRGPAVEPSPNPADGMAETPGGASSLHA